MDVYELRIYYSNLDGKRAENVLHVQPQSAPASADPFTVAGDVLTAWRLANETFLVQLLGTDVTITAYSGKRVNNGGGPTASLLSGVPGLGGSQCVSMLAAANLAMLPPTAPFARKTGHVYVPGVYEGSWLGDVIDPTFLTAATAYASALVTTFVANGATWETVIYDRTTTTAVVPNNIICRPTITSLRRRTRPKIA
jgi:hypothetical protein